MPFLTAFDGNLKKKLAKLSKKDKQRYEIIMKKIEQIASCSWQEIEHFKNLRYDLSYLKRVHIDKSFVLTFKVDKIKNTILFLDFDHHDNIYKK